MSCILRPWSLNDIPQLVENANNFNIARNLRDVFPHPYTDEDGVQFINVVSEQDPRQVLAIDIEGRSIGSIGINLLTDIHKKNAELGYWVGEKYWGKGIATEAIRQMIDYTFENFNVNRIFASVFESNQASRKALEKNGFILEASFDKTLYKFGEYHNELILAIRM